MLPQVALDCTENGGIVIDSKDDGLGHALSNQFDVAEITGHRAGQLGSFSLPLLPVQVRASQRFSECDSTGPCYTSAETGHDGLTLTEHTMPDTRPGSGLQTLFAIFLGLMVTAFVGVGVYTFYPPPTAQYRDQITRLDRQQEAIRNSRPDAALSADDRARMQQVIDERDKLQDKQRAATESWSGRTSIILVSLATIAMAISLVAIPQLPVISNGLLLGGVFTMLYGVGWVIASGTSTSRFVVMTVALVITLALGYVRFVRRRASAQTRSGETAAFGGDLVELEQRVRTLEERLAQAATALAVPK